MIEPLPRRDAVELQLFVRDLQVLAGCLAASEGAAARRLLLDALDRLPPVTCPLVLWTVRGLTSTTLKRIGDTQATLPRSWEDHVHQVWLARDLDEIRAVARRAVTILTTCAACPPAPDDRASAAVAYMRANFHRPALNLDRVSEVVHLSRWHLGRLLRRETGETYRKLLRGMRLERATELLDGSGLSIKEVACAVGYLYPTELDRDFRRTFGMTPGEWRRRTKRRHLEPSRADGRNIG